MPVRVRNKIGTHDAVCGSCGHRGLVLVQSRAVRRRAARFNPFWRARRRTYDMCPVCGTRSEEIDGSRLHAGRSRIGTALGWTLAAFLSLVVLLETVAAAVITAFISLWLAFAVVVVVIASAVVMAVDARRRGRAQPEIAGG